jgi:hypothetical protein
MTRKQASKSEAILRSRGVYKPYVSVTDGILSIESYPLTAIVKDGGCDPEMGPVQTVKIIDHSLARTGVDPVLTTERVFLGQSLLGRVAGLLTAFHGTSYERAKAQDAAAGVR